MAAIEKRGDAYRIIVSCGLDSDGKQIKKYRSWRPDPGMNEKQIQKELSRQTVEFEELCKRGLALDGSMKFADFVQLWRTKYAIPELKEKTVQSYDNMLKRILPALGHLRMDRIQPTHLLAFYEQLRGEGVKAAGLAFRGSFGEWLHDHGYSKTAFAKAAGLGEATIQALAEGCRVSPGSAERVAAAAGVPVSDLFEEPSGQLSEKTILNYHRLISSILKTAVQWQVIQSNPAERVRAPRVKKKPVSFLDEQQTAYLLEQLEQEPLEFRAMIYLLLFSGMRRGELLGLEWPDIDFANNRVYIQRNRVYLPGEGIITTSPKTDSSVRSEALPASVMDLLAAWKAEQDPPGLIIFTRPDGASIHPDTITDQFKKFCQRIGLDGVHLHSLRHTNASLLIAAGVDLRTVAGRLGHAQTSTTANIYSHFIKSADERAAEALENMLKGNN